MSGERLLDPLVFDYVNVVANRLLPAFCEKLDSYRAFTVLYDSTANGDKDLALHYDNAEVTLNINIGGTWGGGNVPGLSSCFVFMFLFCHDRLYVSTPRCSILHGGQ